MLDLLNTGAKLKANFQGGKSWSGSRETQLSVGFLDSTAFLTGRRKSAGTLKLFMGNERQLVC